MLALFSHRAHARYITFSSLEATLVELLTRFTDQRLKRGDGRALTNKLNEALVRLLENSDRENVIVCLLGFVNRSAGPTSAGMQWAETKCSSLGQRRTNIILHSFVTANTKPFSD